MKLANILLEQNRYYAGKPLESGGTSIAGTAAPAVKWLFKLGMLAGKVLDYGAGKYARNADFLRAHHDLDVFAYDPFNHNDKGTGWESGSVSNRLPRDKFDVGFSCFVLNVVPKSVEVEIIDKLKKKARKSFHVVRNMDVFDSVKKALARKDKVVYGFFIDEFMNGKVPEKITDELIMEFCEFGVQTSKGFQRIPNLEEYGFTLIKKTDGYKVYQL